MKKTAFPGPISNTFRSCFLRFFFFILDKPYSFHYPFLLLIALILYPFCYTLEKKKWPRSLAIALSMALVFLLFLGILWLLMWQLTFLKNDIPFLVEKLEEGLQGWLKEKFDLDFNFESYWLENLTANSGNGFGTFLQAVV